MTVCLLVVFCEPLPASRGTQKDSGPTEKIRQEVERFRENDLLRVVFHDGSEKWGCLKRTETEGLLLGAPNAFEEKVLYSDIATVKRGDRSRLQKFLRGVLGAATVGAVWFGVAKVGSNTPKTMAVKVPAGLALSLVIVSSEGPRRPTCR